jgi:HlyD family secretion protein
MDIARPDIGLRRQRRQRVFLVVSAAVLLVVAVVAVRVGAAATPEVDRADVLIEAVQRGEFVRALRGPGKLVPSESRWAVARTDGTVERLLVQPGAAVKAGDAILELSNPEVQDRWMAAEADCAAADASHQALRAQMQAGLLEVESAVADVRGRLEAARVMEEASRLGLEKGAIAAVQYKQAAIELESMRARMAIETQRLDQARLNLRAQVDASQARLAQLARTRDLRRLEAEALKVTAGLDGVVQRLDVEVGQRVAAGASLARVARAGTLMAELRVAEAQAADLAVGQAATVQVGRNRVEGRVRRVNPMIEKGSILVEVALLGDLPAGARAEQAVDGTIVVDRLADALFVARPVDALPDSVGSVFRMAGSDGAERTAVRFGKESATQIQVLDGLVEGDRVIVSDTRSFEGAAKVALD